MIVLGGGLAGLAAGYYGRAPVYEAAPHAGGVAGSVHVDGFTFDQGIHILQTQHQEIHALFSDVGVGLGTHRRNAHIFSHDCYTAYPFQVNTAGLPIGLRAKCLWNYFRRDLKADPDNYEEWIHKSIGRGFGQTFLIPYSEKFWTVSPREMTYEWTANRIPETSKWQVLRGAFINRQTTIGNNAVFQYPPPQNGNTGYGVIGIAMERHTDEVYCNHRAVNIDADRHTIDFHNGAAVPYGTLVSTIPLPELIPLIPQAPDDVRQAARRLRCNSIYVVNLGFDCTAFSQKHWVHFPGKDVSFFRISYPSNFSPGMAPEGQCSVAAEIAYSKWAPIDRESIVQRVIDDLTRVRAIPEAAPVISKSTIDIKYGYVIYDKNRKQAVRQIHDWLNSVDIHATGRYGLWAYLWSHEAILAGKRTALRLQRKDPQDGRVQSV